MHILPHPSPPAEHSAITWLDRLLAAALRAGASDLHFESDASHFRVRFRVDGQLRVAATPPLDMRDALLTRLKVLARMDIAEKRLPQDGRLGHVHDAQSVDLRVSSMPTLHGEKLVLRVLDFHQTAPELSTLGFEPEQLAHVQSALQSSDGMVLITGPTGSGKTRSLYAGLNALNRTELNVSTIEDPVEIQLPGINQVQIHERAGLTFSNALRAMLRQDPDVIMLGEIRDTETAVTALQAAQTGHLVLSTLHTPNAPSTLARLQHMGVATHHLAASMRLVVAQRLVRRLCPHCRYPLSREQQAHALSHLTDTDRRVLAQPLHDDAPLYDARGCAECEGGYKARIGVFQVLPVSAALQTMLFEHASVQALAAQAEREHVQTLRQSAWRKAWSGHTSWSEVLRQTPQA